LKLICGNDQKPAIIDCWLRKRLVITNRQNVNDLDFNRYIKVTGKLAGIDEIINFSHKRTNKKVKVSKAKYA